MVGRCFHLEGISHYERTGNWKKPEYPEKAPDGWSCEQVSHTESVPEPRATVIDSVLVFLCDLAC